MRNLRLPVFAVLLFVAVAWPLAVHAGGLPAPDFALAQADAPPPDPGIAGVPSLEQAPLQFAAVVVQLAQKGQWGAFAFVLLFALVWAVRKFASKLPDGKVKETLLSKWGGWTLNLLFALAAGVAGLLLVGGPVSVLPVLGIVGSAVTYAFAAAGMVELQKDVLGKSDAAAAAVVTKADAVRVLEKGPPAP